MTDLVRTEPVSARPQVLPPGQLSLSELATKIQRHHAEVMKALGYGCAEAIAAGDALIAAKKQLKDQHGHGSWQDYLAIELHLGLRTAQLYMLLARNKDKLQQLLAAKNANGSFLTQKEALKFLSVGRKNRRRLSKRKSTKSENAARGSAAA
jgi:hypothetical protein